MSFGTPPQGAPQPGTPPQGTPQFGVPGHGTPPQGMPQPGPSRSGTTQQGMPPVGTPPYGIPPAQYLPPTEQPARGKGVIRLYQGLGLVGVALVSGLVWWAFQPGHESGTAAPQGTATTQGKYTFTRVAGPATDTDCAAHSFGKTQQFFQQHPCQQLLRAVYSTTLPDGLQAMTSVAVVRMADEASAGQLRALTNGDQTGNVADLIREGVQVPSAPTSGQLQEGGYASGASGSTVTIALSAFVGGHQDNALLKDISNDALRTQAK